MKTTENKYQELKTELQTFQDKWRKGEHKNYARVLDANWIGITIPNWRLAKKVGAKKDGYYGWMLWSGSTQDSGTRFADEVREICNKYDVDLGKSERQL